MKTVRDLLQDADPLRHEPRPLERRERLRRAVLDGGIDTTTSTIWQSTPLALLVSVVVIIGAVMALGSGFWSERGSTLQAQIRFEVRLAENQLTQGLVEARIQGSDRVVYLYDAVIVTNDDIAESRVVEDDAPSRFGVAVELNAAGARRMREATSSHVGKPIAILIDGAVVTAPVVRTVIGTSGVMTGGYTRAEAERIVEGIGVR